MNHNMFSKNALTINKLVSGTPLKLFLIASKTYVGGNK